jgi:phosphoglycerate dehydrogenase-like enzyme
MSFFLENNNSKKWSKNRNLDELCKKNIYILGCGNIGKSIASKLIPFGCNITGFDLIDDHNNAFPIKTISNLINSLPKADVVIICLPLNQQTYHYVDINFLSKMKKNGLLINVSRGAIIDTSCLINFLNENKAFTAYLDVFEEEPLKPSSPLWDLDNLKITPHNTFVSKNNKKKLFEHYYSFLKELKA